MVMRLSAASAVFVTLLAGAAAQPPHSCDGRAAGSGVCDSDGDFGGSDGCGGVLDGLLAPLDANRFFREHWQRTPTLLRGGDAVAAAVAAVINASRVQVGVASRASPSFSNSAGSPSSRADAFAALLPVEDLEDLVAHASCTPCVVFLSERCL